MLTDSELMLLTVKVQPNSKRFGLSLKSKVKVQVRAMPEKGKANAELQSELEKILGCPVRVIRGQTSQNKVLEIGISEDEFKRRTEAYLQQEKR
jgi:uncharacterized protein (TIGR00251 family)